MRFFYFCADQEITNCPPELKYAFPGGTHATSLLGRGPNGGKGTLVRHRDDQFKVRTFDKETQAWRRMPDSHVWIGWTIEDPPNPDDLRKDKQLEGHLVTLSDGHQWLMPVARRIIGEGDDMHYEPALPIRYGMDDNGQWMAGGVVEEYARLWQIATESVDKWAVVAADEIELTVSDICGYCAEVIGVNYHISPFEVGCLELLNGEANTEIMMALLDLQSIAKKKIPSDTLSTPRGVTDESPTTDQPMLTST